MSLNTSLMEGQMPAYSMPQPKRYPQNPPSANYPQNPASSSYTKSYPTASSYTGSGKSYPTASSYTGSGKPEGLTGPTSSYPLASSTTGYNQGYNQPYSRGYTGSTSTAPQQYTGSTSTAPQQYTGAVTAAPQYSGSTSTAPEYTVDSAPPRQYMGSTSTDVPYNTGSTSQYPASSSQVPAASAASYPAAPATKPREVLPSTTSYAPSSASALNNNTATSKVLQSQKSTFSRAATARSHASLNTPAARLVQRGPPPRFRPYMIIVVTMAVGCLFIGIVLTVVAHWPGYTSIGNDPLEIVGPVLFAVGGAGIIVCVIVSVILSRQEKQAFMQKIAASQRSIYHSRMTMQQSMHSIPAMDSQSAMLKHPSTSTYGAPLGEGDSGHPSTQTYNSNMSYEPDSDASEQNAGGKYEVYKIDTLPDPSGAMSAAMGGAAGASASQDHVPQPVRQRTRDTKKRSKADATKYPAGISTDPAYQPAASTGRTSPMAGSGALGGVGGVGSPMVGAPDLGGAGAGSRRQMHDYSGDGFDVYDPEAAPRKEKKKKSRKPKREAEAMQATSNPNANPSANPNPNAYQAGYGGYDPNTSGYNEQQEPLRIAIRAQPGAQVSITPGYSAHSQQTHHDSAETEI